MNQVLHSGDQKDPQNIIVAVAKLSGMVIMGTVGNMTCQEWCCACSYGYMVIFGIFIQALLILGVFL